MARPDLQARADALRAEAIAARRALDETYESRRASLSRETTRVMRESELASYGAERAAAHAKGTRIQAENLRDVIEHTEQDAVKREQQGKTVEAEEAREVAGMKRREVEA